MMRKRLEYWLVVAVARTLGALPRRWRAGLQGLLTWAVYHGFGRLRTSWRTQSGTGLPRTSKKDQKTELRGVYRHLGWQLVEFCRMSRYTR